MVIQDDDARINVQISSNYPSCITNQNTEAGLQPEFSSENDEAPVEELGNYHLSNWDTERRIGAPVRYGYSYLFLYAFTMAAMLRERNLILLNQADSLNWLEAMQQKMTSLPQNKT